jgi:hypothetical protein
MGSDIRAPVGLEYLMTRRAHYPVLPYLKRAVLRTPAAQVFINDMKLVWQTFHDAADLSRQVRQVLAEHLVRHAAQYALTPDEVVALDKLSMSDASKEQVSHGQEAGRSAVILSRERFEPSGGVIVDE